MSARRYVVVVQAEQGYPATWPSDETPIPSPSQPVLYTAVLLTDYEAVEAEVERLRALLDELHASVKDKLSAMNYYFGPNARTAVSSESVEAYNRIVAALDAAAERRKEPS